MKGGKQYHTCRFTLYFEVILIISDRIRENKLMGGLGSGGKGLRHKAWRSRKLKTTNLPELTIPELIKLHKANPNSTFTFNDIRLTVAETGSVVHLERIKGEKLHTATIKISTVPCNYGGFRYYALCPICQKRVRTLYLHQNLLACRHCFRMGYMSQNATLSQRLRTKRRAIGKKINNDEWTKPKWMRKKTFAKLRSEYLDLGEKEQIADFFSLRKNSSVNRIFDEFGCAIIAAEMWGLQQLGNGFCNP